MKKFTNPEIEVVSVEVEDIIATSYEHPEDATPDDEL